jgi:hypothetical protein
MFLLYAEIDRLHNIINELYSEIDNEK